MDQPWKEAPWSHVWEQKRLLGHFLPRTSSGIEVTSAAAAQEENLPHLFRPATPLPHPVPPSHVPQPLLPPSHPLPYLRILLLAASRTVPTPNSGSAHVLNYLLIVPAAQ